MRTKIDERRAHEAYDRTHPWQPLGTAIIDNGVVCELLFSDMVTTRSARFFLAEDDHWYRIDPPGRLPKQGGWFNGRTPMNWRPVDPPAKISPAKRSAVMHSANKRGW